MPSRTCIKLPDGSGVSLIPSRILPLAVLEGSVLHLHIIRVIHLEARVCYKDSLAFLLDIVDVIRQLVVNGSQQCGPYNPPGFCSIC